MGIVYPILRFSTSCSAYRRRLAERWLRRAVGRCGSGRRQPFGATGLDTVRRGPFRVARRRTGNSERRVRWLSKMKVAQVDGRQVVLWG